MIKKEEVKMIRISRGSNATGLSLRFESMPMILQINKGR